MRCRFAMSSPGAETVGLALVPASEEEEKGPELRQRAGKLGE